MHSDCPASVGLPTVEECREAASVIWDDLLRSCVWSQCGNIGGQCGVAVREQCAKHNLIWGGTELAFTITSQGILHRVSPAKESYWCGEPASHECVVKALIHELAHACGWDHKDGYGVPGNDPQVSIPECQ